MRPAFAVARDLPIGCLLLAIATAPAAAQQAAIETAPEIERASPRLAVAAVDWSAARQTLATLKESVDTAPAPDPLAALDAATAKLFPNIAASPVPVLLPFDTAALLRDAAQGVTADAGKYLSDFQAPAVFLAGPSGYDAEFALPHDAGGLQLTFARNVEVQITGAAFVYELAPPLLAEEDALPALQSDFPGIRRVLLEENLRYSFTRFGVPYVVSIKCFDGAATARRLSCREADKVAVHFLKALNIAGGAPQSAANAPPQIARPQPVSPDFTYYAPGDLLPGTGMKGQAGRTDATVYAAIRFPMAQAPDYVNSQSFMNWGDCNFTGRVGLEGGAYRCRVNSIPLVRDEAKNYAYPWRDNFCEHRDFYVGQCPTGYGHQGEDIRPSSCVLAKPDADRCEPYQHELLAAADGVVMRDPGDEALYLVVDRPGEHVRLRYLHMNPQLLDAAGMINGRVLAAGDVIGTVDDYERRQGGTTYHLHLDMQVLGRDGWVFVNPYMTLVAAYERLIGARGRLVRDAPPAADAAPPSAIVAAEGEASSTSGREHRTISAAHCQTRIVKGHRRRRCEPDRADRRPRRAHAVRAVDRRVSR